MRRTTWQRATGVIATLALAALAGSVLPAQKKDDRKSEGAGFTEAQRQELAPVLRLVDEVMKGAAPGTYLMSGATAKEPAAPQLQAPPADVPMTFRNDFLKATTGLIYVPFTVAVEPGKLASSSVAGYLRVAPKGSTTPAPAADASADKGKGAKADASPYPFEDAYFAEMRGASGQPLRLSRAMAVPPGTYDVYIALRERAASGTTPDKPVKVAVLKQELTVPDYHADALQTSSVMVADKIDQLSAPLPPDAQKERPYVIGDNEITPAQDTKFKKSEEIVVIFQIYGATLAADKKPDVSVEYMFHQRDAAGAEKPFNKTPPQAYNTQTLPPGFDGSAGHQILAGQGIPLASFPEGDFRLELKVTDNKAGKSITRDVLFTVVPG